MDEKRKALEFYFAPMEGITGYVFRNAHHACFPSMDRYYTPFITPKSGKSFTARELNDVLPEHNEGITVIPQILTNQPEGFWKVAKKLKEFGYKQVNLNLGCPSGTVVAKKKGAGFLAYPKELDSFLEQIFEAADLEISVKTRIGRDDPEEFGPLLEIFNKYPLERLIIHPRVQTDYYKNSPNLNVYAYALSHSKNPLCYNGDLFTAEKTAAFCASYPQNRAVMLGRGLLVNPALVSAVKKGAERNAEALPEKAGLWEFLNRLAEDYSRILSGERDVLFKMKELWFYLGKLFPDGEKQLKAIRKSQHLSQYNQAVTALLNNCPIVCSKTYRF